MASRKGVAEVVSVVLVIAVAIAVGIMVTIFITSWTRTQISDTSVSCAINTNFNIQDIKYNASGFNNTLLIKLINDGKSSVYGFGVTISNGTEVYRLNSSSSSIHQGGVTAGNKLAQKQTAFITLNLTTANISEGFGKSLKTSAAVEVSVTNDACPSVSSSLTTLTAYP